jgi:hypothetical protein
MVALRVFAFSCKVTNLRRVISVDEESNFYAEIHKAQTILDASKNV